MSVLEPASALGVAASVVQFVDFTSRVIGKSADIRRLGATAENLELETVTRNLVSLSSSLRSSLHHKEQVGDLTDVELATTTLGHECQKIALELLDVLGKIKARDSSGKWQSLQAAIVSLWTQEKIDAIEQRLSRFRQEMIMNILMSLRDELAGFNRNQLSKDRVDQGLGETFLQYVGESRRWRNDIIDAIFRSQRIDDRRETLSMSSLRDEALARRLLLSLQFREMYDRSEQIPEAYHKTFTWILQEPSAENETGKAIWPSYVEWLTCRSGFYWVTGKPGSGKSTLMKYIYTDPRTPKFLATWAGDAQLINAAFFFWMSGSGIQKSDTGLLRSLLYQILEKIPELIPIAFPSRWEVYELFDNDPYRHSWGMSELSKAMKNITSHRGKLRKFALFIDGIDEFAGDPSDIIEFLKLLAVDSNIKLCVASRPHTVFQEAFSESPYIMMQDLTADDIKIYANGKFLSSRHFLDLELQDPEFAREIVRDIAAKSSGVFLWVYLVVGSLLSGFMNGDRISDLKRRIEELPPDLEDLFGGILTSIEPFYIQHSAQLFQMALRTLIIPSLLNLYFADEEENDSLFKTHVLGFSKEQLAAKEILMARRLNSCCRGLLEVVERRGQRIVLFLHRTVKDFFVTSDFARNWFSSARREHFDVHLALCKGALFALKFTLNMGAQQDEESTEVGESGRERRTYSAQEPIYGSRTFVSWREKRHDIARNPSSPELHEEWQGEEGRQAVWQIAPYIIIYASQTDRSSASYVPALLDELSNVLNSLARQIGLSVFDDLTSGLPTRLENSRELSLDVEGSKFSHYIAYYLVHFSIFLGIDLYARHLCEGGLGRNPLGDDTPDLFRRDLLNDALLPELPSTKSTETNLDLSKYRRLSPGCVQLLLQHGYDSTSRIDFVISKMRSTIDTSIWLEIGEVFLSYGSPWDERQLKTLKVGILENPSLLKKFPVELQRLRILQKEYHVCIPPTPEPPPEGELERQPPSPLAVLEPEIVESPRTLKLQHMGASIDHDAPPPPAENILCVKVLKTPPQRKLWWKLRNLCRLK